MRADRSSLKSEREENCSRKFAKNVPFIMITIKKNFATLCQKSLYRILTSAISIWILTKAKLVL